MDAAKASMGDLTPVGSAATSVETRNGGFKTVSVVSDEVF